MPEGTEERPSESLLSRAAGHLAQEPAESVLRYALSWMSGKPRDDMVVAVRVTALENKLGLGHLCFLPLVR